MLKSFAKLWSVADNNSRYGHYLRRGALWSLGLQATAALLTFAGAIAMARLGGDQDFGMYSGINAWIQVLSMGALLGLDDVLIRDLPRYSAVNQAERIKGLLRFGLAASVAGALTLMFVLALLIEFGGSAYLQQFRPYWLVALPALFFFVVLHFAQTALRGLHHIASGQFAEKFLKPLFVLLGLAGLYLLQLPINDHQLLLIGTLSFVPPMLWAMFTLYKRSASLWRGAADYSDRKRWYASMLPFLLMSLLQMLCVRQDLLWLGYWLPQQPEIMGYYNVAARFGDLLLIPFFALVTVAQPLFSAYHEHRQRSDLNALVHRTRLFSTALMGAGLLVVLIAGHWLLRWFGPSFELAYPALLLLCISQMSYAVCGPVAALLLMTGHERTALIGYAGAALAQALLHIWLTPHYAMTGAATAVAISTWGFNLYCWHKARTKGILKEA